MLFKNPFPDVFFGGWCSLYSLFSGGGGQKSDRPLEKITMRFVETLSKILKILDTKSDKKRYHKFNFWKN